MIELCIDICRRNGKTKLLWLADKTKTLAYEPAEDEMVLSVHRWFANKSCPGEWMYSRMGDLAEKVTAALGGATTPTTSESRERIIWDTLFAAIGNAFGVAGLMGNLYAESSLNPQNLQNNGNNKLGMTDAEFTAAFDSGSYAADTFIHDGYGYGLAQWTYYSRKQALLNYAKAAGKSIGDLTMQLGFLLREIKSYKTVWNMICNAASVREASDVVLLKYEMPADQSEAVQIKRAGYGQKYYDKYANPAGSSVPYLVRVTNHTLNYRKGPGVEYDSYGYIAPGIYTIVEEQNGWGLLKGYAKYRNGWVCLKYTEKLDG